MYVIVSYARGVCMRRRREDGSIEKDETEGDEALGVLKAT